MGVWAKRIWPTNHLGLRVALVGLYMSGSKGGVGGTPLASRNNPGLLTAKL